MHDNNSTDRYSFILKPSTIEGGGIGVFLLHNVVEGTYMELFLPDFEEELCNPEDVPEELRGYCLDREGGKILCPKYFNRLDIGNYLNHSKERANLRFEEGEGSFGYFATRAIQKGEELFADYTQLGEPNEAWDSYYVDKKG